MKMISARSTFSLNFMATSFLYGYALIYQPSTKRSQKSFPEDFWADTADSSPRKPEFSVYAFAQELCFSSCNNLSEMTEYSELATGLRLDLHAVCDLVEQLSERGDITEMPEDVWEEIASGWLGTLTAEVIEFVDEFNHKYPGSAFESLSIRPVRSDGEWDNFVELRFSPKFDEVLRMPGPVIQDILEPVSESCYPEGLTFIIGVSRSGRCDSSGQRHAYSYTAIDLGGLEAHDRFIAFAKFHEDIIHSTYRDIDVECQHSIGVDDVKFDDSDAVAYLKQYASSRELSTYSSDSANADIGFTLRHVVKAGQAPEATEGAVRMMVFFDILAQYFYARRDRQTHYFGGEF